MEDDTPGLDRKEAKKLEKQRRKREKKEDKMKKKKAKKAKKEARRREKNERKNARPQHLCDACQSILVTDPSVAVIYPASDKGKEEYDEPKLRVLQGPSSNVPIDHAGHDDLCLDHVGLLRQRSNESSEASKVTAEAATTKTVEFWTGTALTGLQDQDLLDKLIMKMEARKWKVFLAPAPSVSIWTPRLSPCLYIWIYLVGERLDVGYEQHASMYLEIALKSKRTAFQMVNVVPTSRKQGFEGCFGSDDVVWYYGVDYKKPNGQYKSLEDVDSKSSWLETIWADRFEM